MLGFDFSAFDAPPGTTSYAFVNLEAASLVARMTDSPDNARKQLIDTLIGQLKAAGIWAKLDAFYMIAAHSPHAALLNWKADQWNLIVEGTPLFRADRGYATDGIDDALSLGVGASGLNQFQQNSATIAVWVRSHLFNQAGTLGNGNTSGAWVQLIPRNSTGAIGVRLNSATAVSGAAVGTGYGLTAATRSSSTAVQCYKNGAVSGAAGSAASAARSATTLKLGVSNGTAVDQQFQFACFGSALSAQEHADLYVAVNEYLTAIGVTDLPTATPTWASEAVGLLPDGVAPLTIGKGLNGLGMVRDPVDGSWWIARGTGSASLTQAGLAHLSPDFSTVLSDWRLSDINTTDTGGTIADLLAGSCQGVTIDSSDNTIYMINKATASGAQLVRLAKSGQLLSVVALPSASSNGLAYDALRDKLIVGLTGGNIVWHNKDGTVASGAGAKTIRLSASEYGDQLYHDPATDTLWMSKDGATVNDPCSCEIWHLSDADYPLPWRAVNALLSSSRAIEGVYPFGGKLYTVCDGSFHTNDVRSDNHWRRHIVS